MNNDISPTPSKNTVSDEIPIPPEILEMRRKERRFKILTPIFGISLFVLCFISLALMAGKWETAIWILAIGVPVVFLGSALTAKHVRQTEDMIKDIVNSRK
ncbi:MAG: hypothetical protein HUU38_23315 [Anaerolineales bacterium]|nr:hypothetical protein [Anaerolineales bacterium]